MSNVPDPEELFIRCACGNDGVNIVQDDETGEVYLAVWYCNKTDMCTSHKLRWIWKIIQGKPYADEVVIDAGRLPLIIDKLSTMRNIAEQIRNRERRDV